MAYLVYRKIALPDGCFQYDEARHVRLGGGGLISLACKPLLKNRDTAWVVPEADLLTAGGFSPTQHALVINTTPGRPAPDIFHVRKVAGYSYNEWTPVMISMEVLFNGDSQLDTAFDDRASTRLPVRTILYLHGGYGGGHWNWGGNSRTTAAVLWDDAWDHFKKVERH